MSESRLRLAARRLRSAAGLIAVAMALGMVSASANSRKLPELRLNDLQVVGSHNSYRSGVTPAVLAYLSQTRRDAVRAFDYGNPPIADQLDLGLRQIEIDTFADPQGGLFVGGPVAAANVPGTSDDARMASPGFKVMHIPGIDTQTNCATLVLCLEQVRQWSRSHPDHLPIFITIDSKDYPFKFPGAIVPLRLSPDLLEDLDQEIRLVFPQDRLITPDVVRAGFATLREAVLAGNWPTLERSRGKVMIIFDVGERTANTYREGHPSLHGRAMFSLYPESDPEAATFIVQDPRRKVGYIQKLVKQGFIVRTRSDADMVEGARLDYSGWHAAKNSGAQMISTDYYPRPAGPAPDAFRLSFGKSGLVRCNPVRTSGACLLTKRQGGSGQ